MPIISAEPMQNQIYRVSIMVYQGIIENLVITADGLYSVYYVKNSHIENHTGKILSVVQNRACPSKSYILLDCSDDKSGRRERILFYQIQTIKDVTPNNAYKIACEHGFNGTVEDWLLSLKGDPGSTAYELAVEAGFKGSVEEWLESLRGYRGYSAYDIAVQNGFVGTEKDWLVSIRGERGYSAYEIAVQNGFDGTQEEWLESLKGKSAYQIAVDKGFEGTEEEWFAKNGDITLLAQKVERIGTAVTWNPYM